MITSTTNRRVKWVRALQNRTKARRDEGLFVVEGLRLAYEVIAAEHPAHLVFHSDHLDPRGRGLVNNLARLGAEIQVVSDSVMAACSATETPPGLLVVVPEVELELPTDVSLALVIDRMRTPGNLGAILRTASAAGVQAVFTTEGTVDATNPKVVRGAMGAHFRLPMRRLDPESLVAQLHGLKVWITRAAEGLPHYLVDWRTPLALIIGGEAHGASARLQESATDITHIPMPGGGESLNASVAAGVFLFEIARQRATTPPA